VGGQLKQKSQTQGRPKAHRRCQMRYMQKSSEGGVAKIRKLGETKFKFGQLVLRKIIKIVATSCHILRQKCTKFDFGWADPAGELTALPRPPIAGFKGSYL